MTSYTNPWTGKPVDKVSDLLPQPNGQTCDECGSPCIDNCIMCGAPQCCPACCYDETPSARITGDKDRSVQSRAPTSTSDILALLSDGANLARFWSKVDIRALNECWPWTGTRNRKGYGQFNVGGRNEVASRVMLALRHGENLSRQQLACHHCDTPSCVNPSHLFVGSHQDNMVDAVSKGRINLGNLSRGEHNLAKTECLRGHPLTADNIYVDRNGWRQCRICQRKNRAEWKRRKKELAHA